MKESGSFDLKSKFSFLNKLKFWQKDGSSSEQAQIQPDTVTELNGDGQNPRNKFLEVTRIVCTVIYRLRAVFLSIPVIIAALRLAAYNSDHLPLLVGLNLQTTGEFAKVISRQTAVTVPLLITGGCLVLTLFSRKVLYPWLISVFSLAIPVLLLITNTYPA